MSDLQLTKINTIQNSSTIGSDLDNILTNINNNFQSILSNDYLQGKSGNNIEVKVLDFKDENSEESTGILKNDDDDCYTYNELRIVIENAIKGSQTSTHSPINGKQWNDNLKEFSITTIVEKNEDEKYILKHSLYHVFSDARFENPLNDQGYAQLTNLSCVVYYNGTEWVANKIFPTIYYKNGGFYWNINGQNTDISAQGPKGESGTTPVYVSKSTSINNDNQLIISEIIGENIEINPDKFNGAASLCIYSNNNNNIVEIHPCKLSTEQGGIRGILSTEGIGAAITSSNLISLMESNIGGSLTNGPYSSLFIPINQSADKLHLIAASQIDINSGEGHQTPGNTDKTQPVLKIFPSNYDKNNGKQNLISARDQVNANIKLQIDYKDIELNSIVKTTGADSKIYIPVEENKLFSTNESNEITLIDNAMNSELNPNRLAFLNPDHIKIYRHNVDPKDNDSNWPALNPDEDGFWQDINQWDDIKNSKGQELSNEEITKKINQLKTSLVTQGLGTTNSIKLTTGRSPFPQIVSPEKTFDYDILKVEILTADYDDVDNNGNKTYLSFGELYGIVRKFHFLITQNHEIEIPRSDGKTYANITGYVDIFEEIIKNGEITKNKIETVKIYGWPGHSSTPMNFDFGNNKGGSLNNRGTASKLIFEFYLKNDNYSGGDEEVLIDHYTKNNKQWKDDGVGLEISGIRLFARKFWANSTGIDLLTGSKNASPLASYGHLYGWDTEQNAIFPNGIIANNCVIGEKNQNGPSAYDNYIEVAKRENEKRIIHVQNCDVKIFSGELSIPGGGLIATHKDNKIRNQIPITYQSLVKLKNDSLLTPGVKYRINDYKDDDYPFDIIVEATEVNKLSEIAKAARSNNDNGYFGDCNLDAWEIKYCLDNNTSRFDWVDTTNGKGVIYYMKDEYGNEAPYDFKHIKHLINGELYYTFGKESDDSLNGNSYNNVIKEYKNGKKIHLNNIVLGVNCNNNTFGNGCHDNILGSKCCNNTFGNGCHDNILGSGCCNNTFGNGCHKIYFFDQSGISSQGCSNNTIGNKCNYIFLTNGSNNNTFGNSCEKIHILEAPESKPYGYEGYSTTSLCVKNSIFGDGCKGLILTLGKNVTDGNNVYIHSGPSEKKYSIIGLYSYPNISTDTYLETETDFHRVTFDFDNITFNYSYGNKNDNGYYLPYCEDYTSDPNFALAITFSSDSLSGQKGLLLGRINYGSYAKRSGQHW